MYLRNVQLDRYVCAIYCLHGGSLSCNYVLILLEFTAYIESDISSRNQGPVLSTSDREVRIVRAWTPCTHSGALDHGYWVTPTFLPPRPLLQTRVTSVDYLIRAGILSCCPASFERPEYTVMSFSQYLRSLTWLHELSKSRVPRSTLQLSAGRGTTCFSFPGGGRAAYVVMIILVALPLYVNVSCTLRRSFTHCVNCFRAATTSTHFFCSAENRPLVMQGVHENRGTVTMNPYQRKQRPFSRN